MTLSTIGLLILSYGILGGLAYGADLRWGLDVRGFCIDLISPEPQERTQGFLVGRARGDQFFWAGLLAAGIAAGTMGLGFGIWYVEIPRALLGAMAALAGMQVAPLGLRGLRRIGLLGPETTRLAIASVDDGAGGSEAEEAEQDSCEVEVEVEEPAPALPTAEELRQAKIDRMDDLLGKKKDR